METFIDSLRTIDVPPFWLIHNADTGKDSIDMISIWEECKCSVSGKCLLFGSILSYTVNETINTKIDTTFTLLM